MGGKPVIGVTMGDPAGIGPEIAVKALSDPELYRLCSPILIGDLRLLERTAKELGIRVAFNASSSPRGTHGEAGVIDGGLEEHRFRRLTEGQGLCGSG